MSGSRVPRRRALTTLLVAAIGSISLLAGCGSDSADGQAPSTTQGAASRIALLDAAGKTVLDQAVAYPGGTAAQLTSSIVELPPGAETGWHRHDTPLYGYVLEGTVTVTYEPDIVKDYPAGTAFLEAIGTYHNGANRGTEMVRILTVSMGAEGLANTTAKP